MRRGFTMPELMVVIAIMAILLGIGMAVFINTRKSAELNTLSDNILFALEEARSDAMAGKGGVSYGVKIDPGTYTFFAGSSYNSSDPTNRVLTVAGNYQLSTLPDPNMAFIFARITGLPNQTGTTTIADANDPSRTEKIFIGVQGDITVVK